VGAHLRVFCTKRPAMVVVGAHLRAFCTKRPAMVVVGGLLEGHVGGGGLLEGVQIPMA
jgi:hypothetical protein